MDNYGPWVFAFAMIALAIWVGLPVILRHARKRPLNKELPWGGWFKIVKDVYATDRETFYVSYWNKSETEWYSDSNKYPTKAEAEARADALYDELLVEEGIPA